MSDYLIIYNYNNCKIYLQNLNSICFIDNTQLLLFLKCNSNNIAFYMLFYLQKNHMFQHTLVLPSRHCPLVISYFWPASHRLEVVSFEQTISATAQTCNSSTTCELEYSAGQTVFPRQSLITSSSQVTAGGLSSSSKLSHVSVT